MNVFWGQVHVSPVGYKWDGLEEALADYTAEEFHENSAGEYIMLNPVNHTEIMKVFREKNDLDLGGKFYDPFIVEPALFRMFAGLGEDPNAILKFANQYGDIAEFQDIVEEDGCSLWNWHGRIAEMQEAVETADILATADKPTRGTKARSAEICRLLEEQLCEAKVWFSPIEESGKIVLRTVVWELLAVMNIQLALSITEQKRYRSCDFCGKPFELTPQINRSDRLFCTDNCRVKAYQRRKRQVIDLHIEGQKLRQIVDATGADMKTVKKWIDSFKAKGK